MDQRRKKNTFGKKRIKSPRTIAPTVQTKKKSIASILIYAVVVLTSYCSSSFAVASPLVSSSSSSSSSSSPSPAAVTFIASSSRFGRGGALSLLRRSSTAAFSSVFDEGRGQQQQQQQQQRQHHYQSSKVHYHRPFVGRAMLVDPRLDIGQQTCHSSTTTRIMSSQQSTSETTTTATTTTTTSSESQRMIMDESSSNSEGEYFDEGEFASFKDAVESIISKRNVMRDFRKNEEDLIVVKEHLLDDRRKLPQWGIAEFLPPKESGSDNNDNNNNNEGGFTTTKEKEDADADAVVVPYVKQKLRQRSETYLHRTGLTPQQHKLATILLAHLADHCAKKSSPGPLRVAWEKVLEAGCTPLSRTLSTYLYVLGLESSETDDNDDDNDDDKRDIVAEVATLHDALYEPTEKTTTLLVKSLVSRGDAAGAESLLSTIADGPLGETLRHRTTSPLLQLYCAKGEIGSALRLYHKMRTTSRVKMDAATYADFIAAVAEHGYFGRDSECIVGAEDLGYYNRGEEVGGVGGACGAELMDALIAEMAEDVLDIDEASARVLRDGFAKGFEGATSATTTTTTTNTTTTTMEPAATSLLDEGTLVAHRVAIDNATARCPATRAALRLITIEDSQRRHVHDTLLVMAREKSIEYTARLAAKGRSTADNAEKAEQATRMLAEFSEWLDARDGEPYTAIVDGANVAYYGWGRVNVHQLMHMVDALEKQGENVLVVFPKKYTWKKFHLRKGVVQVLKDEELEFLEGLEEKGKMYVVPPMCLDDLYWMLASVSNQTKSANGRTIHVPKSNAQGRFPGPRPMVISNDKMRDHKMDLLDERAFRRWCCSHIVNYDFEEFIEDHTEERAIHFRAADVFSDEIQGNAVDGGGGRTVWHFPVSEWDGNERFCLRLPA